MEGNKKMSKENMVESLSASLAWSREDVEETLRDFCSEVSSLLANKKYLHFSSSGYLYVKKSDECIWEDIETNKRYLMPPKLELLFLSEQEYKMNYSDLQNIDAEEFTLDSLADNISRKTSRSTSECTLFIQGVYSFIFTHISKGLSVDLIGLGIFKVDSSRVSFEPEEKIAALINKPFSFFEKMELIDDSPSIQIPTEEKKPNKPIVQEAKEPAPIVEPELSNEIHVEEKLFVEENKAVEEKKEGFSGTKKYLYIASFILLLFVSVYYISQKTSQNTTESVSLSTTTTSNKNAETPKVKEEVRPLTQEETVVVAEETTVSAEVPKNATVGEKEIQSLEIPDVIATIKMKQGDMLTHYALKYYGDKIFWVYIYSYNKANIKDLRKLLVGTEIKIPAKHLYDIDANNKASLLKAETLQKQIENR